MIVIIFLGVLIGVMALGVPIAFALLATGICMMAYLGIFNTQIIAQNIMTGADSFAMMAIPFFVMAGDLMNRGGITKRIVDAALSCVGHIKGGLGYCTIIAALLFASLVGSAVASTVALATILIPMMVKAGYDRNRSTALVASSNLLAPIMPPSSPMIIFGVTASVSISKMFIAGIMPAIYISSGLAITWAFIVRKDKLDVLPKKSFKEVIKSLINAIWAIFMPIIIIVGMRGGIFTPTEAGVVACAYALFVGVFIYKELKIKDIFDSLVSSAKTSSIIMFLAASAMVSSWIMNVGNIPQIISGVLHPFVEHPKLLMLMIGLFVLLIGTSMDVNPIIFIMTPIVMPLVKAANIDPVYFGVMFCFMCVIGLLTPPLGNVLNVACAAGKITMVDIVKANMPFLIVEIILLLLMILFPQLVIIPLNFLS